MGNVFDMKVKLSNGVEMPVLGFGVWQIPDDGTAENAVKDALEFGYRSIDTAEAYDNECGVGKAIIESGIPRKDVFITTKVDNPNQGYDKCLESFDRSLENLKTDYVDLYLVHWPMRKTYLQTWLALVRLYEEKRVRAIGVSNFKVLHIEAIVEESGVWPTVNQIERHPHLIQKEMIDYGREHGILIEAYSPLMQGNLNIPLLIELAKKYGKTPAQIVLRWHLQGGVMIIPKSANRNRILENSQLDGFELSSQDMNMIDALNENKYYLHDFAEYPWGS